MPSECEADVVVSRSDNLFFNGCFTAYTTSVICSYLANASFSSRRSLFVCIRIQICFLPYYSTILLFFVNIFLRDSPQNVNSQIFLALYPILGYDRADERSVLMIFIEILKAIFFGIVEGVTEWLPVSSTGHLILLDTFLHLDVSEAFYEMFQVVIQLGAILAVIVLFFHKLNPFAPSKNEVQKKATWSLWFKVVMAVVPSAVVGLLLDDWMDEHLYNYIVVAIMLIAYGIAFLFVEKWNASRNFRIKNVYEIDYRTALLMGAFQCLSLIPGTSRSGSTILGAIILGVARPAGAEFSFFMAIPTMLGASALKLLKYALEIVKGEALAPNGTEIAVLITGCIVAFVVSLLVIKGLMEYVRKHSFSVFGVYRIILGIVVLGYFAVTALV